MFLTRYTDLVTHFVSLYNTMMKVFFISSSLYIVYLMKVKFRATNDPRLDTFQVQYLVAGCLLLSLIANYAFTLQEVTLNFPNICFGVRNRHTLRNWVSGAEKGLRDQAIRRSDFESCWHAKNCSIAWRYAPVNQLDREAVRRAPGEHQESIGGSSRTRSLKMIIMFRDIGLICPSKCTLLSVC